MLATSRWAGSSHHIHLRFKLQFIHLSSDSWPSGRWFLDKVNNLCRNFQGKWKEWETRWWQVEREGGGLGRPAKGEPPGGGRQMNTQGHWMEERGGPRFLVWAKGEWHYDSLRKGTWLRRFVGEMMSSTIFKFLCFSGIWLPILRRMRLLITLKIKNNNKELAPLSMKLAPCSLRGGTSSDSRARSVLLLKQGVISTGPIFVGKRMKRWVESAYTEISTW